MDRSHEEGRPPKNKEDAPSRTTYTSKVTADFGGRRKIFDRRLRQMPIPHTERRSGGDRRSGFDRRSTIGPKGAFIVDRRQKDFTPPTGPDVDTFS